MIFPIGGGLLFAVLLLLARQWPAVLLLVIAMAVWGLYYEFFGFATQQYVSEVAPPHGRASAWGVVSMVKSTVYMLGPLAGAWALRYGEAWVLGTAIILLILAYVLFRLIKIPSRPVVVEVHEINLRSEFSHWTVLFEHIWPILLASMVLGLVDALFWTNGTILNDRLALRSSLGGLFVSVYMFPSLLAPWVLSRMQIATAKKRKTYLLILASGIVLATIGLRNEVWWYLLIVLLSSFLLALAWPILDAVYTDLLARMGRERKHLIGLGNSTMSLAYVVGPFIAGTLAQYTGEVGSFVAMGILLAVTAGCLLFVTPRKLLLPQQEIGTWE